MSDNTFIEYAYLLNMLEISVNGSLNQAIDHYVNMTLSI